MYNNPMAGYPVPDRQLNLSKKERKQLAEQKRNRGGAPNTNGQAPNRDQLQQQYVKKNTGAQAQSNQQQQLSEQEKIDQMNQMASEQLGDTGELTAAQKFDLMFSMGAGSLPPKQEEIKQQESTHKQQQQPATQAQPKNPGNRRRFKKEQLLTKFVKLEEVNFSCFQKDVLNWLEIFASSAQEPEASTSTDHKPNESTTLQQKPRPPMGGKGFQQNKWRGAPGAQYHPPQEEDENEEDPEWIDFDPKKESSSFFGRAITNEQELRDNIKSQKNLQQQMGYSRGGKEQDDDEFEKLIREEQEAQKAKAASLGLDKDLEHQVDSLAQDLEKNERNFSDIDMIYEKNAKQKQTQQQRRQQQALDDDELDDVFNSLMQAEAKKKQSPNKEEAQKKQIQEQKSQQQQQQPQVQLPQNLIQQIENLSIQQKQQIQAQKIVVQAKPKFTALQNVQNLFSALPVVTHEKHRIKMDEISKIQEESQKGDLFKQVMASINPFSKYIIDETQNQQGSISQNDENQDERVWTLEESIFQKPMGQAVNPDTLKKTSSEMFVIYKYFSDPLIKVKSEKYTEDKFVQIKDLFQANNLLQTSPLNLQLQQQMPQMMNPQAKMMMGGNMMMNFQQVPGAGGFNPTAQNFIPQPRPQQVNQQENKPLQQQQQQPAQQAQQDIEKQQQQQVQEQQKRELQKAPQQYLAQPQVQQQNLMGMSLEDDEDDGDYYSQNPRVDLTSMESQLKSLLGFNPR